MTELPCFQCYNPISYSGVQKNIGSARCGGGGVISSPRPTSGFPQGLENREKNNGRGGGGGRGSPGILF